MNTDSYKEKLLAEKKLLVEELGDVAVEDPQSHDWIATTDTISDADVADENDLADKFEDLTEHHATEKTLGERLSIIERALAKIEEGTYGTCDICGNSIETARLDANAGAVTCLKDAY